MKTLARNHVTCSLCGLTYATIEVGFLSVRRLCNEVFRITQTVQFSSVQFSSRKLEDSKICQEVVAQGRSVVDVLTLRVL
jgi:hypothetical protein